MLSFSVSERDADRYSPEGVRHKMHFADQGHTLTFRDTASPLTRDIFVTDIPRSAVAHHFVQLVVTAEAKVILHVRQVRRHTYLGPQISSGCDHLSSYGNSLLREWSQRAARDQLVPEWLWDEGASRHNVDSVYAALLAQCRDDGQYGLQKVGCFLSDPGGALVDVYSTTRIVVEV